MHDPTSKKFKIAYETIQKSNKRTLELFTDLLGDLQVTLPLYFIHRVVKADAIPLLVYLKQTDKCFNLQDKNNSTPLHLIKSVEAAKILIEGGAEINPYWSKETPLRKALVKNRIEIAKFLIESGAAIEPKDEKLMATIPELSGMVSKKAADPTATNDEELMATIAADVKATENEELMAAIPELSGMVSKKAADLKATKEAPNYLQTIFSFFTSLFPIKWIKSLLSWVFSKL